MGYWSRSQHYSRDEVVEKIEEAEELRRQDRIAQWEEERNDG